jgi:hypothetical protein
MCLVWLIHYSLKNNLTKLENYITNSIIKYAKKTRKRLIFPEMAGFIAVDTYLGIWKLIKEIDGLV